MQKQRMLVGLLGLLCISLSAAEPLVVRLTPPRIDAQSIAVRAACDRPRRNEKGINIALQESAGQSVLHCYGHGGMGFTTLFGSVNEALQLLFEKKPSKQTPIRVIGSGCMGLLMACELYRHGFKNVTISTKEIHNLPSWRAGGFFDPGVGNETTPSGHHALNLGLATFRALHAIEHGHHPYLTKDVVRRLPIYWPADIECGVEILEKRGLVPPSELVTIDFGNGVVHKNFKRQLTYFIDVTGLMEQLWQQVERCGIVVVQEEVKSFADCKEKIICNCTGLGSKELAGDQLMQPVRGHFFMLQPMQEKLDYMLFTKTVEGDRKDFIYFFPKPRFVDKDGKEHACCGMLGGTYLPHNLDDKELQKMDEEEFERLEKRTVSFCCGDKEQ